MYNKYYKTKLAYRNCICLSDLIAFTWLQVLETKHLTQIFELFANPNSLTLW